MNDRLIKTGRCMFAIAITALGIFCITSKDFIIGRPPEWPKGFNGNPALAYISGVIIIAAGIAILLNKKAVQAAFFIFALILFLSVSRHLPHLSLDSVNAYKTIALFGGALLIMLSFYKTNPQAAPQFFKNNNVTAAFELTGCICLALFFIDGGYAHFKYADFVNQFIPAYIPFHPFFTYGCGICLIAGGVGIVIPQTRSWAALLSAIMIAGWFLLLHIPRVIANINDVSDRMGLCESFAFAGICFCLAGITEKKMKAGDK